jgi:hypothetical protein
VFCVYGISASLMRGVMWPDLKEGRWSERNGLRSFSQNASFTRRFRGNIFPGRWWAPLGCGYLRAYRCPAAGQGFVAAA